MYLTASNTPLAQQAQKKLADAEWFFNDIRNDNNLSAEGKQRALAREWWARRKEVKALEAQELRGRKDRRDTLHRDLFGASSYVSGADVISQRDAADRASRLESEDEAERLMTQARRSNDTTLMKAIAQHAFERKWVATLEHYADGNTGIEGKINELYELSTDVTSTAAIASMLGHAAAFDMPKPREIDGLAASVLDAFVGEPTTEWAQPAATRTQFGRSDRAADYDAGYDATALNGTGPASSLESSLGGQA